ncbi:unnamed protein product [Boreogadus saida]
MFSMWSFVVSTVRATVVHVKTPGGGPQTLLREHCAPLHAVACHPRRPILAMGSHSGILKVCDYNTKLTLASRVNAINAPSPEITSALGKISGECRNSGSGAMVGHAHFGFRGKLRLYYSESRGTGKYKQ